MFYGFITTRTTPSWVGNIVIVPLRYNLVDEPHGDSSFGTDFVYVGKSSLSNKTQILENLDVFSIDQTTQPPEGIEEDDVDDG